jgi:hypothetical protein
MPDGSWIQARHCHDHGTVIPTELALQTRGALLFKFDSDPFASMPVKRHVAISLGDDSTIEAQGSATDVGVFRNAGKRDWRFGARIPGVDYGPGTSGRTASEEEEDVSILMFLADGQGQAHPYVVSGIVGKHVSSPEALELHKNLQKLAAKADPSKVTILGEAKPLGKEWQDAIALMDGPLRNVS